MNNERLRIKVAQGESLEDGTPFLTINDETDSKIQKPPQINNFMPTDEQAKILTNIFFGLNDRSIKNNEGLSFNNSSSATFLNNDEDTQQKQDTPK